MEEVRINIESVGRFCDDCPLKLRKEKHYVPPEISESSRVLIVGEAPGAEEVVAGRPFVGRAGRVLHHALRRAGYTRTAFKYTRPQYKYIGISNVVLCQPPQNRTPTVAEMKCCQGHLFDEIRTYKPKLIICLGNAARYPFLGSKSGVTKDHGRMIKLWYSDDDWCYVGFTFHPAAVLHQRGQAGPSDLTKIISDLKRFKRVVKKGLRSNHLDALRIYETEDEVRELVQLISELPSNVPIAVDIETSGLDRFNDDILSVSFSWKEKESHVIYLASMSPEEKEIVMSLISNIMSSPNLKVGNNVVFDAIWLRQRGCKVENFVFDNMLIHQVLNPDLSHGLKQMVRHLTDYDDYGVDYAAITSLSKEELCRYNGSDSSFSLIIYNILREAVDDGGRLEGLSKMLSLVVEMLQDVHMYGINVSLSALHDLRLEYESKVAELEDKLREISGDPDFNPKSAQQVRDLLYKKLGLKAIKQTKAGAFSVDRSSLLSLDHEAAHLIERHRHYSKMLSTYINGLESRLVDGKFYPEFGITGDTYRRGGTVSGRLTSTLHVFPSRGEDAVIKKCFISSFPGGKILECDLSQIELRVITFLSRDPVMLEAYKSRRDVHRLTASRLFGKDENEVTKDERFIGKTCIPGDMYVFTDVGFKKMADIQPGDSVWTGASYRQVVEKRAMGLRDVIRITTERGYSIELTPDHEILVLEPDGELNMRQAGSLSEGNYVILSPKQTECKLDPLKIAWQPQGGMTCYKPLEVQEHLDEQLAEFLGWLVADGSIYRNGNSWCISFGIKKEYKVKRLLPLTESLFGDRARVHKYNDVYHVSIHSKDIPSWLESIGFDINNYVARLGDDKKTVPHMITRSSSDVKKAFLRGLFYGDGSYDSRISICFKSRTLAEQVLMMLLDLGIVASFRSARVKGYGDYHYIHISGGSEKKFIDMINCPRFKYKKRKPSTRLSMPYYRRDELINFYNGLKYNRLKERIRLHLKGHSKLPLDCAWAAGLIPEGWIPLRIEMIRHVGEKEVFDIEVETEHRFVCQGFIVSNCNFSMVYGVSPEGLASRFTDVHISVEEAERFIDIFFTTYHGIRRFLDKVEKFAHEKKKIVSLFGRVRYLQDAFAVDPGYAYRFAKNFIIQSTASDIALMGTVKLHNLIKARNLRSRIIGMKHDSVLLDVHPDEEQEVIRLAVESFRKPPIKIFFPDINFDVPLDVSVAIGPNWYEVEELELDKLNL